MAVTLTSAEICLVKRNRFAKAISYYVMHVPSRSEEKRVVAVGPVTACGGSASVSIGARRSKLGLTDYLLGAHVTRSVTLKGFDEIGRMVTTAKMEF